MASSKRPNYMVETKLTPERKRRKSDLVLMWHSIWGVTAIIVKELWVSLNGLWEFIQIWFSSSERFIVQRWLEKYLPYVPEDFSESWRDGRLLAILLNKLHPGCFPDAFHLDPDYGLKNVYRIFDALEIYFGIKPDVSVEEIITCSDGSDSKLFTILLQLKHLADNQSENEEPGPQVIANSESPVVSPNCIAKGTGLAVGFVGRSTSFIIFCAVMSDLDVVVEIKGPNSVCSERITKRSPRRKRSISSWEYSRQLTRSLSFSEDNSNLVTEEEENFENRIIPLEYEMMGNQISVSYKPMEKGKHKVSILWHGHHVSDSPYLVTIEDPSEAVGAKHVTQLKSALKTANESEKHDSRKISFRLQESQIKNEKLEHSVKVTPAVKVVSRKVLRYIVKIHGKDIPVNAESTQSLATELLKMDYDFDTSPSFHRRNSWGFAGDAERKKSVIRQFCVDVNELEAQITQRRTRSLSINSGSKQLLEKSDSFDSLTKLNSLYEDVFENNEKDRENEDKYAYAQENIDKDVNETNEKNEMMSDCSKEMLNHVDIEKKVDATLISAELRESNCDESFIKISNCEAEFGKISPTSTGNSETEKVNRAEDDFQSTISICSSSFINDQENIDVAENMSLTSQYTNTHFQIDRTKHAKSISQTLKNVKLPLSHKSSKINGCRINPESKLLEKSYSFDNLIKKLIKLNEDVSENSGKYYEDKDEYAYVKEDKDVNETNERSEMTPSCSKKMPNHLNIEERIDTSLISSKFTESKFDESFIKISNCETDFVKISPLSIHNSESEKVDRSEDDLQSTSLLCPASLKHDQEIIDVAENVSLSCQYSNIDFQTDRTKHARFMSETIQYAKFPLSYTSSKINFRNINTGSKKLLEKNDSFDNLISKLNKLNEDDFDSSAKSYKNEDNCAYVNEDEYAYVNEDINKDVYETNGRNEMISDFSEKMQNHTNIEEKNGASLLSSEFTESKFNESFSKISYCEPEFDKISSLSIDNSEIEKIDRPEDDLQSSISKYTSSQKHDQENVGVAENMLCSQCSNIDLQIDRTKHSRSVSKTLKRAKLPLSYRISRTNIYRKKNYYFPHSLKKSKRIERKIRKPPVKYFYENQIQSKSFVYPLSQSQNTVFKKNDEKKKMSHPTRTKIPSEVFQNSQTDTSKISIALAVVNENKKSTTCSNGFSGRRVNVSQECLSKITNNGNDNHTFEKLCIENSEQNKKSKTYHVSKNFTQNEETSVNHEAKNINQETGVQQLVLKRNVNLITPLSLPNSETESQSLVMSKLSSVRRLHSDSGKSDKLSSSLTYPETKAKDVNVRRTKPLRTHTLKALQQLNFKQFNPSFETESNVSPVKTQIGHWERTLSSEKQSVSSQKLYDFDAEQVNIKEKMAFWEHRAEQQSKTKRILKHNKDAYLNINKKSCRGISDFVGNDDLQNFHGSGNISNNQVATSKEKIETSVNKEANAATKNQTDDKISPKCQLSPHKISRRSYSDPVVSETTIMDNSKNVECSSLESPDKECSSSSSVDNLEEFDTDDSEDSGGDYILHSTEDEYIDDEISDRATEYWGDLSIVKGWKATQCPTDYYSILGEDFLQNYRQRDKSYPEECKVFGIAVYYGYVAIKNRFQVYTGDAGFGNLSVSMQGFRQHEVSLISVVYSRNDIYEVIYQVMTSGYYLISIRWLDKEITGSPFVCKVTF